MQRYGLLGEKLGHSYSPQIHAQLASYPYDLYEVAPERLDAFLRMTELAGMNVTIPYKKAVIPYCKALSPAAARIGSVNTLVRRADGWYGDNTDYDGFCYMARNFAIAGKKALVLGNGGVSLTVQQALRDLGAREAVVISRRGPDNYQNLARHADAQIIANATPVGMYPNNGASPLDLAGFPRLEGVLDLIYNPARTALLLQAERRGIACNGGLGMLVAQAKRAAELFTGRAIADSEIERITRSLAGQMQNIVLIGMPGCGKTTLGKALADRLGRPFYDADAVLEQRTGRSIPEIFRCDGEAAFRALETQTLAELGKGSGAVIATGGGCVTRPENAPLLRQNGRVVWVKRPLDRLPVSGRPISQRMSAAAIYAQRRDRYAAFAAYTVENDGPLAETLAKLLEVLQ